MTSFEFTLKFSLAGRDIDPDTYIEILAAAGCDDALIGTGLAGRIALDFGREAKSAFEAVNSAIADVKKAIPDAQLVEATPDLVGLTDVADIMQCSRQYIRKLMLKSGASFPMPVHDGKTALWRLSHILLWLRDVKSYQVDESLLAVAEANRQFNLARELPDIDKELLKRINSLLS